MKISSATVDLSRTDRQTYKDKANKNGEVPVHDMKTYMGSRAKAPLILIISAVYGGERSAL